MKSNRPRVRVTHADDHRDMVGTIIGPATQAGMDVVVNFGNGDLAEFREWELTPDLSNDTAVQDQK